MNCTNQMLASLALSLLSMTLGRAEAPVAISADTAEEFAATFEPTGATPESFARVLVVRDLQYARYGDTRLLLDLYLPAQRDASVACVVTITGGGFRARGKEAFARYAAFLATRGFAAACISYRGAPHDPFPSSVHDCKAAVRFVRSHASKFNIDSDRIGALGQSAGGHLAAMLALSGGVAALEGDGGNPHVSSRVQAAVSFAGVFDFISRLRDGGHQKKKITMKRKTNGDWIGEPFSETSEKWKSASPITYLSADDPPMLLAHTKTDDTVPLAQSLEMHQAMQTEGLISELLVFETGGHGVSSAPAINQQLWSATIKFLTQHLKAGG